MVLFGGSAGSGVLLPGAILGSLPVVRLPGVRSPGPGREELPDGRPGGNVGRPPFAFPVAGLPGLCPVEGLLPSDLCPGRNPGTVPCGVASGGVFALPRGLSGRVPGRSF